MAILKKNKNLEEKTYDKIISTGEIDLERGLLVFSGLTQEKQVLNYQKKLDILQERFNNFSEYRNKFVLDKNQFVCAHTLYDSLSDAKFDRYLAHSPLLTTAIDYQMTPFESDSVGDCRSLSHLYSVLGNRENLDLGVFENEEHIFNYLNFEDKKIPIDHTIPSGFGKKREDVEFKSRNLDFLVPCLLDSRGYELIGVDDEGAISYFNKAIELEPTFGEAYVNRAIARLKTGKSAQARCAKRDIEAAQSLGCDDKWIYLIKGFSDSQLGKNKMAYFSLSRALQINPELKGAHMVMGKIARKYKKHELATREFDLEAKVDETNPEVYYLRGLTKMNLEDYSGAIEDLQLSADLGGNRKSYFFMSFAKKKLQLQEESREDLKKYWELRTKKITEGFKAMKKKKSNKNMDSGEMDFTGFGEY